MKEISKKKNPKKLLKKIIREQLKSKDTYRFIAKIDKRKLFDELIQNQRSIGKNPFEIWEEKEKKTMDSNIKEFAEEIVESAAKRGMTIEEFRMAVYLAKKMVNYSQVERASTERADFFSKETNTALRMDK